MVLFPNIHDKIICDNMLGFFCAISPYHLLDCNVLNYLLHSVSGHVPENLPVRIASLSPLARHVDAMYRSIKYQVLEESDKRADRDFLSDCHERPPYCLSNMLTHVRQ